MHPSLPALQVQQSTLRLLFMLLRFRGSIGLRDPTMSGPGSQNASNLLREWDPAVWSTKSYASLLHHSHGPSAVPLERFSIGSSSCSVAVLRLLPLASVASPPPRAPLLRLFAFSANLSQGSGGSPASNSSEP